MNLNEISINKKYKISSLNIDEVTSRRFMDIGIIPGVNIEKILISPFGGISAYNVMGSLIAIRDKDVEGVLVDEYL